MKLTPQERASFLMSRRDPENYKRTCRNCGAPFQTRIAQQHICSERCRAKYAQRKHRAIERTKAALHLDLNTIIPCALITLAAVWILLPAAIIFWLVADILLTAVITHPVSWLLIIGTITSTLAWAITCRHIKTITSQPRYINLKDILPEALCSA